MVYSDVGILTHSATQKSDLDRALAFCCVNVEADLNTHLILLGYNSEGS